MAGVFGGGGDTPDEPVFGVLATWPKRLIALALDWIASNGAAAVLLYSMTGEPRWFATFLPLFVFWAESTLGVTLMQASFGQWLMRLQVRQIDGRRLGAVGAGLRQFLVCLVVPPLVYQPDGRGLHDIATRSGAFVRP